MQNKTAFFILLMLSVSCRPSEKKDGDVSEKSVKLASDELAIESPYIDEVISSPLHIKGKAVGTWYFEGQFTVLLKDGDGKTISTATAKADGPWMTEDWVDFKVSLKFDTPDTNKGYLVFQKDNPSGKSENKVSYHLPVTFHN